ncbi:MAG: hypothetical protein AAB903_02350, partial [Patescibacteria group bacterium]
MKREYPGVCHTRSSALTSSGEAVVFSCKENIVSTEYPLFKKTQWRKMVLCGHMDPTFDIEDPMNTRGTKSNVVVISIIGVAVGMLIGAGIMMYISRDAVFFTAPSTENVGVLSYPDQKAPDVIQKTNILLPKKLVSKDYHLLINKILNELNQVETNNNATLLPLMNSIKQKSAAGDFNGFF